MLLGEIQAFDDLIQVCKEGEKLSFATTEELDNVESLVSIITNPFGRTAEDYTISFNEEIELWCCVHHSVAMDGVSASIFGYGAAPEKAMLDCSHQLEVLIELLKKQNRL